MARLSPWKVEGGLREDTQVLLQELQACLAKMQDRDWVVECCVTAALPSLPATRQLLLFARGCVENNLEGVREGLLLRVSRTLHRLETFSLLQGAGDSVEQWLDFCRADMLSLVLASLRQGALARALLLWTRHLAEFQARLSLDRVRELLEAAPDTQDLSSLLPWLRQLVPDLLELEPRALPLLATWAAGHTRKLELARRKEWPEIGITFSEAVLATLSFSREEERGGDCSSYMTLLTLSQQRAQPDSPLSQFILMINSLKDLLVLHRQFKIKLKLAEFLDPVKFNVVSLILDWTQSPQELAPLLDTFLCQYLARCGLEQDASLAEYIRNMLENTDYTWHWHIGAAPWEEKVAALLSYISSVEAKSGVILEAVKVAPVPWSSCVLAMCREGEQLQHSNAVLVKEQASLVSVKTILRKYDCKSYSTVGREAERLLQLLMARGGEEGLRDARAISHVIGGKGELELQEMYLEHLVRQGGEDRKAVRYLQGVFKEDREQGVALAVHMVTTAGLVLRLEMGVGEEQYMEVVRAVPSLLKGEVGEEVMEAVARADTLVRAWALLTEYGVRVRETDCSGQARSLACSEACRAMLADYISRQIAVLQGEGGGGMKDSYFRLMRLCDLTLVSQEEGVGRLVLELATAGLYQHAIQVGHQMLTS